MLGWLKEMIEIGGTAMFALGYLVQGIFVVLIILLVIRFLSPKYTTDRAGNLMSRRAKWKQG